MSSPPQKSPSKSNRRRRKHSKSNRQKTSTEDPNMAAAVASNQPPPSPESPFEWRLDRSKLKTSSRRPREVKKEPLEPDSPGSPFSWRLERKQVSSPKKSHGIDPSRFHAKENRNEKNQGSSSPARNPEWKETIERNLLIQEQKAFTKTLEARRKEFRKTTQLKTWPLQDMAMEHLDHLLGADASRQFHGGDYLSAESSSSTSSIETSRPRLAPKSSRATPSERSDDKRDKTKHENSKKGENSAIDETGITKSVSPLWSLEPRIFATEKGNGKRKYVVGEFGRIADWYWRKTAPTSRHLYEVIREGAPCRLYFDLEFSKIENPSVPEIRLLRELEDELVAELQLQYGEILPQKLTSLQIVNLDSSNEKKFSRHWIVHLKWKDNNSSQSESEEEFLFKDAPTVGRFVKRMVGRLADDMAADGGDFAQRRPTLAKYLFVQTKDPNKPTCVIDLGVYTRNRLFRCVGSSKKGKDTKLRPVLREIEPEQSENETNDSAESDTSGERLYFPLSMPAQKEINSSQASSSSSGNISSMDTFIAANDWEPHAKALSDSLVVPLKIQSSTSISSENDTSRILTVEEGASGTGSIAKFTVDTSAKESNKYSPATPMARQGSPMPSLDRYVTEHLATRGGVRGSIRAWSIEYGHRDAPVSVTYHLQRNRYCELIGRSHKSNNIFWTIDINSWTCIQGCHDPDCFGRGSPIPISNISKVTTEKTPLDAIKAEFDSWQEEEFEKALSELNLDDIAQATKEETKKETEKEDDSDDFSDDDALLQAIVDNPELFP